MELRHLRYFVAVAEEGSVRRAAQRLNLAQPALSRQIQDLEAELGVALLIRRSTGVGLSDAGRELLKDARPILAAVEQATARARRLGRGQIGTLRIGISEAGAVNSIAAEAIRRFGQDRPEVELILTGMLSSDQAEALRSGQIDAGILQGEMLDDPGMARLAIHEQHVVLAVPEAHPLNTKRRLRLGDLAGVPMVWPSRAGNYRLYQGVLKACLEAGLTPNIVQEVSPSVLITSLVSAGVGVGVVLSDLPWLQRQGVVFREVEDLKVPFRLDLIWRRDSVTPALARFVAAMEAALAG